MSRLNLFQGLRRKIGGIRFLMNKRVQKIKGFKQKGAFLNTLRGRSGWIRHLA